MKRKILVVLVVVACLSYGVYAFAEEASQAQAQEETQVQAQEQQPAEAQMQKPDMMKKHHDDKKNMMMMRCMKNMNKNQMVAASDGGVIVLSGNRLLKYDKNLDLKKEVEIKKSDKMGKMMGGKGACPMSK
ncbi:MAG: hypothetical protein JW946_00520 [Candidatus Omnitrophica bacterium]|nr:hypothetical protein [Candidatus Omnitrophota bacterium]